MAIDPQIDPAGYFAEQRALALSLVAAGDLVGARSVVNALHLWIVTQPNTDSGSRRLEWSQGIAELQRTLAKQIACSIGHQRRPIVFLSPGARQGAVDA